MVHVSRFQTRPQIAMGLVVLIAPENCPCNPIVFLEQIELMLQDVDAQFVRFHRIRGKNAGCSKLRDDEHFVRERASGMFKHLNEPVFRAVPSSVILFIMMKSASLAASLL